VVPPPRLRFIDTARKRGWSLIEALALDANALVLKFAAA
jgi:hypothetical protein